MLKFFYTLLFVSISSFGGYQQPSFEVHQPWKVEQPKDWGSFYWKVNRITTADANGYYYYYVYFYSNSLFNTKNKDGVNYDKAVTYIKNVTVTMLEKDNGVTYNVVPVNAPYVLCDYSFNIQRFEFYFYSKSRHNKFKITYDKVYPYEYYYAN